MQESINTIRFGMAAGAIKNNVKQALILDEDSAFDNSERNELLQLNSSLSVYIYFYFIIKYIKFIRNKLKSLMKRKIYIMNK